MNNYTNNDVNMMNYLCQKITNYVLNDFVKSIINNKNLSLKTLTSNLPTTSQSPTYDLFFTNKEQSTTIYPFIVYTYIKGGTPTTTPTNYTNWTQYTNIAFENYRIIHKIQDTSNPTNPPTFISPVYNLRYDLSYLDPNNTQFSPTPYVMGSDGKTISYPLLLLLSKIAPKIYLEICTSYVNKFFVNIFKNYDIGQRTISTSPQTVNGINQWCVQNNYIDVACGSDKSNKRCACQKCYNMHSYQDRIIANELSKSNTVNNNPWCIYPKCAQGSAFKNQLDVTRSVCSNVSVAGIFIEPSDYSNINVSNTSVTSSSYNDIGINIINNEGCNKCLVDNKDCVVVNSQLTCVDKSQNNVSNVRNVRNVSLGNKGSGKYNNKKFIMLIIIIIILISLIITRISYNKNIKIKYILDICIFLSIVLLIIFSFVIKNKENYTFPDDLVNGRRCQEDISLCQRETPCTDTNTLCINNECMYPLGSFYDSVHSSLVDFPLDGTDIVYDAIITNITHAPESYFTGYYYYSAVINNNIYLFAQNCNLMYDGIKWVEISPNPDQTGFNADVTIPSDIQFYCGKCFTYNNEVYIPQFYKLDGYYKTINYYIYNSSTNIWRSMNTTEILYKQNESSTHIANIDNKGNLYIIRYIIGERNSLFRIYILNLDSKNESLNTINTTNTVTFSYSYINIIDNFIYIMTNELDNSTTTLFIIDLTTSSYKSNIILTNYSNIINYYIDNITKNIIILYTNNQYLNIHIISNDVNTDTSIKNMYNQYDINVCHTMFKTDKYLFMVTINGEIFRYLQTVDPTTKEISAYVNCCYPITNFDTNSIVQI